MSLVALGAPGAPTLWDEITSWQIGMPDLNDLRDLVPIAVAGAIVWSLWLYRVIESRRYRPVENDFRTTTSVVVPSFHEDVPILMRCLATWLDQDPTEVIIVLDLADTEAYDEIQALRDRRVHPILFRHAGKRSALGVGITQARGEILVLVDSDTSWQPGLLAAVQMPFVDPTVGAVSTQQNVHERTSNVWRRIADWLVNLRYYDYVPAMARVGAVACVSGRTGAYRRSVVLPVLDNLENEFFLGRRCVAGDDGRLTWLVLGSGYKTTHQSSARALSMFPAGVRAFVKQRIRWSRNSYRCYLTAVYKGWLWRVPFVTKITVLQILLTPVTMGVTLGYLILSRLQPTVTAISLAVAWLLISRGIRGFSHLRRHPQEILLLPLLVLVVIFIALPVKLYAFATMNKQGWLTRHADSVGGEGQTSADVNRRVARRAVAPVPSHVADPLLTSPIPIRPRPDRALPAVPQPAGGAPSGAHAAAQPSMYEPSAPHPLPARRRSERLPAAARHPGSEQAVVHHGRPSPRPASATTTESVSMTQQLTPARPQAARHLSESEPPAPSPSVPRRRPHANGSEPARRAVNGDER